MQRKQRTETQNYSLAGEEEEGYEDVSNHEPANRRGPSFYNKWSRRSLGYGQRGGGAASSSLSDRSSRTQAALEQAIEVKDETIYIIDRTERIMHETEAIGQEAQTVVETERERLEVANSNLEAASPMMKRAQKDVTVFVRRLMRDKCFMGITFCVICALVAVIVSSQVKKNPFAAPITSFNVTEPTPVPPTPAPTPAPTTSTVANISRQTTLSGNWTAAIISNKTAVIAAAQQFLSSALPLATVAVADVVAGSLIVTYFVSSNYTTTGVDGLINQASLTGITRAFKNLTGSSSPIQLVSTGGLPTTGVPTTAEPSTATATTTGPTSTSNQTAPVDSTTLALASTASPTTADPAAGNATTANPTTSAPTTADPAAGNATTGVAATTADPAAGNATTADPTTSAPTTADPAAGNATTADPTTSSPATADPTTANPTTSALSTADPAAGNATTADPTTNVPSTADPTTNVPSTAEPTTGTPTTVAVPT